ncbi:LrgB family protein [Paenibacillus sacheonensis]|uniref:LrgB family protein n=1 Tax=Paenibacillus sacheonensis TaxID=742054 RepID=A0A7X4YMM7_9BACL|nr:LrgB family protein [Paenibacillus sacheonensis]MBM7564558.1 putative effector of murein hydrolase [Paenibacillus sacheonensis]NBC69115.1 LrgB family protein [Paenibacillus sacheonensis]
MKDSLLADPLLGTTLTLAAYAAGMLLYRKFAWLHPLISAPLLVYLCLRLSSISWETYQIGGGMVSFFLGPATVAMAVPLYKHAMRLRRMLPSLLLGALVGSAAGLIVNASCVLLFGGTSEFLRSALPKSVTAAVAVDLSGWLGGSPGLTAALTVLTGLFGSVTGPWLLRMCGVSDIAASSIAIGAAAHGIGSARLMSDSEEQGGLSGFSMAASAVFTPILLLPVHAWLL